MITMSRIIMILPIRFVHVIDPPPLLSAVELLYSSAPVLENMKLNVIFI